MDAFFGILENTNLGTTYDTETYKVALEVKIYGGTSGHPNRPFGGFRNNGWWVSTPGGTYNPDIGTAYAAGRKFTYVNDSLAPNANDGTMWGKVASGTYDSLFNAAFAKVNADSRWTASNPFHYSFHHEQSVTSEGGGNLAGTPSQYRDAFRRVAYLLWKGGWHASQPGGNILLCYICDGNQYVGSALYGNGKQAYSCEACSPNQMGGVDYSSTVLQTVTLQGKMAPASGSPVVTKYCDVGGGDLYSGLHGVHTFGGPTGLGTLCQEFTNDIGVPWMTGECGCATAASSKLNTGIYSPENYAADMLAFVKAKGTGLGRGQCYGINYTSRIASGGDYRMDADPSVLAAWTTTCNDPAFSRQVGASSNPTAPTTVTVGTPTTSSLKVTWSGQTAGGGTIQDFTLQYRVHGTTTWTTWSPNPVSGTTGQVVSGLTASTQYDFQVQTNNTDGSQSSFSTVVSGTTSGSSPTAPTTVAAGSPTASSLSVSWSGQSAGGGTIAHFLLQYRVHGTTTWTTWSPNPTASPQVVTGLASSTEYDFQIATVDTDTSQSAFSSVFTGTTSAGGSSPTPPTTVSAGSATTSSLALTWSGASAGGGTILDYNVRYRVTGTTTWTTVSGVTSPHTISGLVNATEYDFEVQTVNTDNSTSTWSSVANGTTGTPTPPTISAVGSATTSSLTVTFGAGGAGAGGTISHYVLQYKLHTGTSWISGGTVTSPHAVTGLSAGTGYDFQVATVDTDGSQSVWSAAVSGTTSVVSTTYPQIIIVMIEGQTQTSGPVTTTNAPKVLGPWMSQYDNHTKHTGTAMPSLPDYAALTSGSWQGHNVTPNGDVATVGFAGAAPNIFEQIATLPGLTWRAYEEGVNAAGYSSWDTGVYKAHHCPACFYSNTDAQPGGSADSGRFDFRGAGNHTLVGDIAGNSLPDFAIITPNANNDGHDTASITYVDNWAHGDNPDGDSPAFPGLPALLAAMRPDGILIVTTDNLGTRTNEAAVYTVVASQNISSGQTFSQVTDHFDLLYAIQVAYGLSKFPSSGCETEYNNKSGTPLFQLPLTTSGPPTNSVTDTYARTVAAGGLGTADDGHTYTITPSTQAGQFSVNGSAAVMTAVAGNGPMAYITGYTQPAAGVLMRYQFASLAVGNSQGIGPVMLVVDANNYVTTQILQYVNGTTAVQAVKHIAGVGTVVIQPTLVPSQVASTWYWVRSEFINGLFQSKIWADGSPEPVNWNLQATDPNFAAAPPPSTGSVGFHMFCGSGNTNLSHYLVSDFQSYIPGQSVLAPSYYYSVDGGSFTQTANLGAAMQATLATLSVGPHYFEVIPVNANGSGPPAIYAWQVNSGGGVLNPPTFVSLKDANGNNITAGEDVPAGSELTLTYVPA